MRNKNPILIVEDDPDDCEFLQTALNKIGVDNEQLCFANGDVALAYLKKTRLSTFIIFSDLNMPLLNGLELKAAINCDEQLRKQSIPFVFLSTSANKQQVDQAYDLMVQGFFIKPTSPAELRDLLQMTVNYWDNCIHPNSFS